MRYYDLEKNWGKVVSHLKNEELLKILEQDMNLLLSRWGEKFDKNKVPRDYEWNSWHLEFNIEKEPEYWKYTFFNGCFWLINFNYELAKLVEPNEDWIIVQSDKHATVWNQKDLIFEFNLMAFGWSADDCYDLANR